ncbi:hypothetical protein BDN70DRAFT_591322 [Pholiota conissans]|uniref:Uncharacterized protein n=1 Tax=Pholiota conissans TaxID=109636 RepID=A0A9P6D7B9_9AGAR|nr:hypothetical protein BDN70DRAFT_591322 [Pholiota conissans]
MSTAWSVRVYETSLSKSNNYIRFRDHRSDGEIVDVNDSQHFRVYDPQSITIRIGHVINNILMVQYERQKARRTGIPYRPSPRIPKMRLTASERITVAYCFRMAKQAFDATQNKPYRWCEFLSYPDGSSSSFRPNN